MFKSQLEDILGKKKNRNRNFEEKEEKLLKKDTNWLKIQYQFKSCGWENIQTKLKFTVSAVEKFVSMNE